MIVNSKILVSIKPNGCKISIYASYVNMLYIARGCIPYPMEGRPRDRHEVTRSNFSLKRSEVFVGTEIQYLHAMSQFEVQDINTYAMITIRIVTLQL